jgi:hypothetical protein
MRDKRGQIRAPALHPDPKARTPGQALAPAGGRGSRCPCGRVPEFPHLEEVARSLEGGLRPWGATEPFHVDSEELAGPGALATPDRCGGLAVEVG